MQTIRDSSGFVSQWVGSQIDIELPDGAMSFGFIDKNKLVGGITLYDLKRGSCALAIASRTPRWCLPENLKEMFGRVFKDLGVRYLYTLTPAGNERAKKLASGMGFKQDGVLREMGAEGDDLIVFGMLKRDCPFLELE